MRFIVLYRPEPHPHAPPTQEQQAKLAKFTEQGRKSGIVLADGRLQPSAQGARIRRSRGKVTVIDGPFTESKELVAGFALLQLTSKEEAIEGAQQFLALAGDGEIEIRQVVEPDVHPS